MTIDARDGRSIARLAIKHPVAMNIDIEMAIRALHPVGEMHIFQVHGFAELLQIVVVDLVFVDIEQIPFAIVFEDGPENPAMTVIISKLSVFQLRI